MPRTLIRLVINTLQFIVINLGVLLVVLMFAARIAYNYLRTGQLLPEDNLPPPRTFKKLPTFDNKKYIANIISNYSLHEILRRASAFSGRDFKLALPRTKKLLSALHFQEENSYREGIIEQLSINSDWIPEEFICPISKSIINGVPMKHSFLPFNYDFLYLLMWMKYNNTDPIMRVRTRIIEYTPNHALKLKLDAYIFFIKDVVQLLKRMHPVLASNIIQEAHVRHYAKNGLFFQCIIQKDLKDVLDDERKLAPSPTRGEF
jgi:hypothetical protein